MKKKGLEGKIELLMKKAKKEFGTVDIMYHKVAKIEYTGAGTYLYDSKDEYWLLPEMSPHVMPGYHLIGYDNKWGGNVKVYDQKLKPLYSVNYSHPQPSGDIDPEFYHGPDD